MRATESAHPGAAHSMMRAAHVHSAVRAHRGTAMPAAIAAAHEEGEAAEQSAPHEQSTATEQEGKNKNDQDEIQHCNALLSGVFSLLNRRGFSLSTGTVYQIPVIFERRQSDNSGGGDDN